MCRCAPGDPRCVVSKSGRRVEGSTPARHVRNDARAQYPLSACWNDRGWYVSSDALIQRFRWTHPGLVIPKAALVSRGNQEPQGVGWEEGSACFLQRLTQPPAPREAEMPKPRSDSQLNSSCGPHGSGPRAQRCPRRSRSPLVHLLPSETPPTHAGTLSLLGGTVSGLPALSHRSGSRVDREIFGSMLL